MLQFVFFSKLSNILELSFILCKVSRVSKHIKRGYHLIEDCQINLIIFGLSLDSHLYTTGIKPKYKGRTGASWSFDRLFILTR